jgi:hypothetical protein
LAKLLTIRVTIAWHLVILRILLPGLDGIPAITGGDLDTLAGAPGFKRMSIEAVGDDLPAAFPARWI